QGHASGHRRETRQALGFERRQRLEPRRAKKRIGERTGSVKLAALHTEADFDGRKSQLLCRNVGQGAGTPDRIARAVRLVADLDARLETGCKRLERISI